MNNGYVFIQTNEADGNRVIVFQREPDGRLAGRAAVSTGGRGDGVPHLTSQGSVVLTSDRKHLLVTNAGSNDVSVFSAQSTPELVAFVASGGAGRRASPSTAGSSMS